MSAFTFTAEVREESGKRTAKQARNQGKVPAIIYGGTTKPVSVNLEKAEIMKFEAGKRFFSSVVTIDTGKQKIEALARDVQVHPVTDRPLHIDFQRIIKGEKVRVKIPVRFVGLEKSPGLKRGGILNKVRRTVTCWCNPDNIPGEFIADLGDLYIKEGVHIEDMNLPEGCVPAIDDRNFTVATIVGRGGRRDDEDEEGEEGEAKEPEVITEKKDK